MKTYNIIFTITSENTESTIFVFAKIKMYAVSKIQKVIFEYDKLWQQQFEIWKNLKWFLFLTTFDYMIFGYNVE